MDTAFEDLFCFECVKHKYGINRFCSIILSIDFNILTSKMFIMGQIVFH